VIKKVHVHENGLVEFILLQPVPAGREMKVDHAMLVSIFAEIERTLFELEIKTNASPALSFRPVSEGEYELYMLTAAIPGTVQMRNTKKHWQGRKKRG